MKLGLLNGVENALFVVKEGINGNMLWEDRELVFVDRFTIALIYFRNGSNYAKRPTSS